MNGHPCETCLRWPECNGIDRDTCPLVKAHAEREAAPVRITMQIDPISAMRLNRYRDILYSAANQRRRILP